MNYVNKMVKVTLLSTVVFGFIGCGSGACCESDTSKPEATGYTVPDGTLKEKGTQAPKIPLLPTGNTINFKPDGVANNKDYLIGAKPCEVVKFKDIGEYEKDTKLSYKWIDRCGKLLSSQSEFEHTFHKQGAYETTLVVTDDKNNIGTDHVCVLVGIEKSEIPLMADAGIDTTVNSDETIKLISRLVCQEKEDVTYTWSEDGSTLRFPLTLPVGKHTLILTADDGQTKAKDSVVITVK